MLGPVSGIAQRARMAWATAWPLTAGEAVCFAEQAGRLYPVVRQFGVVAEGPRRRLLFAREERAGENARLQGCTDTPGATLTLYHVRSCSMAGTLRQMAGRGGCTVPPKSAIHVP